MYVGRAPGVLKPEVVLQITSGDLAEDTDRDSAASTLIQLLTHCRSEHVASSVVKAIVSVKTQVST